MPEAPKSAKLSITRKVVLGAGFTLLMLGLIAATSFFTTRNLLKKSKRIVEVRKVFETTERVLQRVAEMENGVRGYIITGEDDSLVPYKNGLSFIVTDIQDLKKATTDNPDQLLRLSRMQGTLGKMMDHFGGIIDRRREAGKSGLPGVIADLNRAENMRIEKELHGALVEDLVEFVQIEKNHFRDLEEDYEDSARVNTSFVMGGTSLVYVTLLIACVLIVRDIRERKATEDALEIERNLLRRIMDTIPDQIFVKDTEGRYVRSNTAHAQYIGKEKAADVVGITDDELFPAELATHLLEDDREVLLSGRAQLDKEEPGRDFGGQSVWLETSKVPLYGVNGELVGLVGISSDITARRAAEEKLHHYAEALRKSNDELQNFASVASHDLQEPLRKVQAFGDRLRTRLAEKLDDSSADYLQRMLGAAARMQQLIQDLLQLSRITTRAQPFERCDLADVVRDVLSDLEVKIAATNAAVVVNGLTWLDADPVQMRQLFQNLIANAIKFQKPGEQPVVYIDGEVKLNLHGELPTSLHAAPFLEIQLRDNGIGFEQKFAEQIFGAFKRLHSREEYEGSGIGLSVCRKITDRHHGKIVAHSNPGEGALFIITLPIHQPQTT